jgi:hypothetical protein
MKRLAKQIALATLVALVTLITAKAASARSIRGPHKLTTIPTRYIRE